MGVRQRDYEQPRLRTAVFVIRSRFVKMFRFGFREVVSERVVEVIQTRGVRGEENLKLSVSGDGR